MDIKRTLKQAAAAGTLVSLERSALSDEIVDGYVAACGPDWFALDVVDQLIRFDGVSCLRYEDVTFCESPPPRAQFVARALRALGAERPRHLGVDLSSLESLLRTAGSLFPVLTVSVELADPGACWVGRLESVSRHLATLQLINPDARWEDEPEEFGLEEITRVDFGSEYERALVLVGGPGGFRFH